MGKRKSITKRTRFEVFKRDSFTCVYCGKSAPSVVLEVDHILPVSKGGDNKMTNLVTSCFDCNRGKADKKISDLTAIEKQKKQLDLLNERNNQLEMMKKWYKELNKIENKEFSIYEEILKESFGGNDIKLSSYGVLDFKKALKKYGLNDMIVATKKSISQYYKCENDIEKVLDYIPRIAYWIKNKQPESLKDIFYIRGIAKNNWNYIDLKKFVTMCKEIYDLTGDIGNIKEKVILCRNWTEFREYYNEVVYG